MFIKIRSLTFLPSTGEEEYDIVSCSDHNVNATICLLAACDHNSNRTGVTDDVNHFLCSYDDMNTTAMFLMDRELVLQGNGPNGTVIYSIHIEVEKGGDQSFFRVLQLQSYLPLVRF